MCVTVVVNSGITEKFCVAFEVFTVALMDIFVATVHVNAALDGRFVRHWACLQWH